ncbi:MAG: riboflavin synthase [Flavobacteriales bacterium]|nr:riboflavin synthase [Flavobacteriales bacterium]|tara:strand:- start:157 stop:735 length:579 start_codon:yes stop_codon:yes gene_type:complete
MFTGIIEEIAKVKELITEGSNLRIVMSSTLSRELKVDQSVAHNGVCLTVEKINGEDYEVVAVKETLDVSNLAKVKEGDLMNIERCMQMNGRLDGHIVQGHVDDVAKVKQIKQEDGSWLFTFELNKPSKLIVEKGSICVNGVSLTAFQIDDNHFTVTIIPYTFEHTNFHQLKLNDEVNIEFDIIGKYVARLHQ